MFPRNAWPKRLPLLPLLALAGLLVFPALAAASLTLSQETSENPVDTEHTVTALAVDDTLEAPIDSILVTFNVMSGPNAGASGTCSGAGDCTTNELGLVSFTYTGAGGAGTDMIRAFYVTGEDTTFSNILEKTWVPVNQPPVAVCTDVTVDADSETCTAFASVENGSFDPDGDPIILIQEPEGPYGLGETPVLLIVMDESGARDTCEATVTVVDVTAPSISVSLDRDMLWPPNHKLVEVCAEVTVTDACDESPTWVLSAATSSEDDNAKKGGGDGNTSNDIQGVGIGTDDACLLLRSERRGNGDGRIYTLEYTASDASGNTATATAEVVVPHDQSGHAMAGAGHTIEDQGATIQFLIPSTGAFDASRVVAGRAFLGNQDGVTAPESWRLQQVTGDAREDLVLEYSAAALQVAVGGSPKGSIDLFYRTDTEYYLVRDLSDLSQVEIPDAPLGDDTGKTEDGTGSGNIAETGLIQVEVFDVQGRMLRSFTRENLPEDFSKLGWDGRDRAGRSVPGGIYFYRIQTPTRSLVQKITIVR